MSTTPRRPLHLLLSAVGWCGFTAVMAWTVAFLAGVLVPRTVDGPVRTGTATAVGTDLALLALFAVQHSVMARPSVKTWMRRRVPTELERTTYVLATDACLALLLLLWQPWTVGTWDGRLWWLDGPAAVALWVVFAGGWTLAVVATYAVDHLELVGLRQAGWGAPRPTVGQGHLEERGLYAVVRHPLMTGLLLAFWATPRMSLSHLMFALGATAYIAVGVRFEERDLRRTFGAAYDDYAARVPSVVPALRRRRHREVATVKV